MPNELDDFRSALKTQIIGTYESIRVHAGRPGSGWLTHRMRLLQALLEHEIRVRLAESETRSAGDYSSRECERWMHLSLADADGDHPDRSEAR